VNRTVDYIKSHLHEGLSVQNLATTQGISPRQLHRRFRLAFGLSVQQFLTRTRIQAAEDALIKSNRSIAEIALAVGFCDQSAFTRQFLKRTGLTPNKFRQRYSVAPTPPREQKSLRRN
jgi:AraC-like DNA-binding protein